MSEGNRQYLSIDGIALLVKAQAGDVMATEDLINLIKTQFMGRRIGRYIGKNRQVDNDDIRQEFLIGVAEGIPKAVIGMGDPVEYIISRGVFRVRSYMRKHIVQGTMQVCMDCGNKSRINRIGRDYVCRKCGSTHVDTTEVNEYDDAAIESITSDGFEDEVISSILINGFEATLTPGTNVHSLYQLLKSGIDRDNPSVKNYTKEIARIWGGCSDQNVVQNIEKLKARLIKWMDSNNIQMKDGILQCRACVI